MQARLFLLVILALFAAPISAFAQPATVEGEAAGGGYCVIHGYWTGSIDCPNCTGYSGRGSGGGGGGGDLVTVLVEGVVKLLEPIFSGPSATERARRRAAELREFERRYAEARKALEEERRRTREFLAECERHTEEGGKRIEAGRQRLADSAIDALLQHESLLKAGNLATSLVKVVPIPSGADFRSEPSPAAGQLKSAEKHSRQASEFAIRGFEYVLNGRAERANAKAGKIFDTPGEFAGHLRFLQAAVPHGRKKTLDPRIQMMRILLENLRRESRRLHNLRDTIRKEGERLPDKPAHEAEIRKTVCRVAQLKDQMSWELLITKLRLDEIESAEEGEKRK